MRLLRDAPSRFEVIHMPPLDRRGHADILGPRVAGCGDDADDDAEYLARTVQALADGRPIYVRALADELARCATRRGARRAQRSDQRARRRCSRPTDGSRSSARFCYELRLHRARGYGALKAILEILADEEGADAHRDLAAAAAHAGLDEGLPVVARGRRSRRLAPEALQLHRSAAAPLGAPALPRRRRRPKTTSRARCTATRCRVCRSRTRRRSRSPPPAAARPTTTRNRGASSRSTDG